MQHHSAQVAEDRCADSHHGYLGAIIEHPPAALTVDLSFGQIGGCFSAIGKNCKIEAKILRIREKFGFPSRSEYKSIEIIRLLCG